ncbi:DUF4351 domain-containing protein [Chlorogloeopsis sp. ULAP01]|uniref:DUF4351 domain-containing protein n=1 Tax=Chlorogloeopsis sp. ULAP01 TaxID=3056483 RepID=UPI0025ABE056|nr:DUF4351 domain-containing protein [Chlorogloeopsis sp. ULAP01]
MSIFGEDDMQESVIYQDILQKGQQQRAFSFCMSLVNERFGEIDSSIVAQVKVLNKEQLEVLVERFLKCQQLLI